MVNNNQTSFGAQVGKAFGKWTNKFLDAAFGEPRIPFYPLRYSLAAVAGNLSKEQIEASLSKRGWPEQAQQEAANLIELYSTNIRLHIANDGKFRDEFNDFADAWKEMREFRKLPHGNGLSGKLKAAATSFGLKGVLSACEHEMANILKHDMVHYELRIAPK